MTDAHIYETQHKSLIKSAVSMTHGVYVVGIDINQKKEIWLPK